MHVFTHIEHLTDGQHHHPVRDEKHYNSPDRSKRKMRDGGMRMHTCVETSMCYFNFGWLFFLHISLALRLQKSQ